MAFTLSYASPSLAQGAATTTSTTQPALDRVQQALSTVNLAKWKTKEEVRRATVENISSIQHDIQDTLPGLLSQADALPDAVTPSFALYRNLNALYDVLLRVSGTASMAGASTDASALSEALASLESARKSLGDRIFDLSQQQQATIVKLESAGKAAPTAGSSASVHGGAVEDGPQTTPKKRKKPSAAKPKPKPSTPQTATQTTPTVTPTNN